MADTKFYVALVNFTDKEIRVSRDWPSEEEAIFDIQKRLEPQAMLNFMGASETPDTDKGKDWHSFGPSDKPFAFADVVEST